MQRGICLYIELGLAWPAAGSCPRSRRLILRKRRRRSENDRRGKGDEQLIPHHTLPDPGTRVVAHFRSRSKLWEPINPKNVKG